MSPKYLSIVLAKEIKEEQSVAHLKLEIRYAGEYDMLVHLRLYQIFYAS